MAILLFFNLSRTASIELGENGMCTFSIPDHPFAVQLYRLQRQFARSTDLIYVCFVLTRLPYHHLLSRRADARATGRVG